MKRARVLIAILLVAAAAVGAWYYYSRANAASNGALTASGTVETTEISIAPEISGRLVDLNVQEGDAVTAGQVLFRLDDALLQAQREQVAANLEVARANAEAAASAAQQAEADLAIAQQKFDTAKSTQAAQREAEVSAARLALLQAQKALSDLEQNAAMVTANAQLSLVKAQKAYSDTLQAHDNLNYLGDSTLAKDARAALLEAQGLVTQLRKYYDSLPGDPKTNPAKAAAALKLRIARIQLTIAQKKVDLYGGDPSAYDLSRADANLALAQAQLELAEIKLDEVKEGPSAKDLALAQERVANAQAALDLTNAQPATQAVDLAQDALNGAMARAAATKSQAAAAKAQVSVAQAALDSLDVQIGKLTVTAPVEGVVLTRSGEPGSVVNPGGIVLTLGRLDELTITVYVPEDRMGNVSLGQNANVSVDSFPGKRFNASVTFISNQAEFTPRNVQTVEGRKNTVFAVKLKLADTSGKLKPGMPADVVFGT